MRTPAGTDPSVRPVFSAVATHKRDEKTTKTLAITAQHIDIRQMIQASEFTIHGTDTPLNKMPEADQFMVCLRIPHAAKKELRRSLIPESVNFWPKASPIIDITRWDRVRYG